MSQILKENLLLLKNYHPRIFKLIHSPGADFYPCVKSKTGTHRIPSVDGKFSHSTIDPDEEARSTVQANLERAEGKDVVVLGCGLGLHVLELLREKEKIGTIYVVEKNVRLFKTSLGFLSLKSIFPKIIFLLDMGVEDVIETIQKNSKSIHVINFVPITRLDKEYFDTLSINLSHKFNRSEFLVDYFERYLKKNRDSMDETFEQIKRNEKLTRNDFQILLLEQIYKKNRKSHANIGS